MKSRHMVQSSDAFQSYAYLSTTEESSVPQPLDSSSFSICVEVKAGSRRTTSRPRNDPHSRRRLCRSALGRNRTLLEPKHIQVVTQPFPVCCCCPLINLGTNVDCRRRNCDKKMHGSHFGEYMTNEMRLGRAISGRNSVMVPNRLGELLTCGNVAEPGKSKGREHDENERVFSWGKRVARVRRKPKREDLRPKRVLQISDSTTAQKIATFKEALKKMMGARPRRSVEQLSLPPKPSRPHCALNVLNFTMQGAA